MKYILGIDIGTQSVKAGLMSLDKMRLERTAAREYPGAALQDAELLWKRTAEAAAELAGDAGGADIEGVGLSGQMHGTVLYDREGRVIGPVINWQDERCNERHEAFGGATAVEKMMELIGPEDFDDLGIDVMASGFMGATLFWLMRRAPETFERAERATLPTDYIRRRLLGGGEYATDPTNAFSSGLFNTREGAWHERAIRKTGLPLEMFPAVRGTMEPAGGVGPEAARLTGLCEGTPVVHGGGDNQMAMIGAGVFSADSPILVNIGTSGQFCAVVDSYVKTPGIDTRSFIKGLYALVGAGLTGGMAYTWLRNLTLADAEAIGLPRAGGAAGMFALLDSLAAGAPSGCGGLRFEPYLRGTRRDPGLRAAFTGITMDNFTIGHRARAVMEGVVEELAGFYRKCGGVRADRVIGAGNGLVKSGLWREITARAFGMPLMAADFENAVYGAALTAAEGLNLAEISRGRFEYASVCRPGG